MDTVELGVAFVLILVVGIACCAVRKEKTRWEDFAIAHHCRVTQQVSGDISVAPIIGGNGGIAVASTPGKTGYSCDDGVTYWR